MKIPILKIPYPKKTRNWILSRLDYSLQSGMITLGKNVEEFENRTKNYIGCKYSVGTNSGTGALEMIIRSLNFKESDNIIIPTNTFFATASAVKHAGCKIKFCDVRKETLCIDPKSLIESIDEKTKAVILVHIGGIVTEDLDEIKEICSTKGLCLIEDAAHAFGAYDSKTKKKAGNIGFAAAHSFYPTKILTTAEGGMVTTNNKEVYEKCLMLREHGKLNPSKNIHYEFGYNWRLAEPLAILGLEQLKRIQFLLYNRRKIANYYDSILENNNNVEIAKHGKGCAYYKYIVYPKNTSVKSIKNIMRERYDINLPGEVYEEPLHSMPVFKKYPNSVVNNSLLKNYKKVCGKHLCLPIYPSLRAIELDYIIKSFLRLI